MHPPDDEMSGLGAYYRIAPCHRPARGGTANIQFDNLVTDAGLASGFVRVY